MGLVPTHLTLLWPHSVRYNLKTMTIGDIMDKFNLPDLCGALADFLDRVNNGRPLKIGGVRAAIDVAYANIHKFHEAQASSDTLVVETMPGVVCSRFARPIARVGLYVPGGTAVLPSTALMLGIPAQVVGCKEIVLATPPRLDGTISPEVKYVAHLVGASAVLKAGGALRRSLLSRMVRRPYPRWTRYSALVISG